MPTIDRYMPARQQDHLFEGIVGVKELTVLAGSQAFLQFPGKKATFFSIGVLMKIG